MSVDKKYEFQYQYFNISSNSQPFYGILDLSQENSIISLDRLRKHQDDITKSSIKHLTKSSYEQQYHDLEYDNIEGICVDFHILIGIEKFDISLKKILVVKEIEGEDEDERIGFRLGNDFLKEFDAEVEGVGNDNLLRRLKFTVQLKEIKDPKDNSNVTEKNIKSIKNQKKFFNFDNNFSGKSYVYIMIATIIFAILLNGFILNRKFFKSKSPIFEDKIKFLIDLEEEINRFNISPSKLKPNEKSIVDLTRNSNAVLSSEIKLLKNILSLQQTMKRTRTLYENSLDYYGNTLWKLKEDSVEDVLLIKPDSLYDRLSSLIFVNQREDKINEFEFDSYYSSLNSFLNKFGDKVDFFQQIAKNEEKMNQLQNEFDDITNNGAKYKKFFEEISRIIYDDLKNIQNIKLEFEKLEENNVVIGYIFMKLEKDFIRILKDRDFNHGEYEQIDSYLSTIRNNRIKFLKTAGLSVKD